MIVLFLLGQISCASSNKQSPPQSTSSIQPPTQKPYVIYNKKYYPIPSSAGYEENGIASWYGPKFHGRPTSNGERYDMYKATAAHKILPMNTILLVKNLENGKEEIVRINDRGPFIRGRIIDLSYTTAKKLGILKKGTAKVRITALAPKTRKGSINKALYEFDKGEFYVQIGSFANKGNALRLQKKFTDSGHTAIVQKYTSPERVFYRVQVFAGTLLQQAKQAERALLDRGYVGAFIVAR